MDLYLNIEQIWAGAHWRGAPKARKVWFGNVFYFAILPLLGLTTYLLFAFVNAFAGIVYAVGVFAALILWYAYRANKICWQNSELYAADYSGIYATTQKDFECLRDGRPWSYFQIDYKDIECYTLKLFDNNQRGTFVIYFRRPENRGDYGMINSLTMYGTSNPLELKIILERNGIPIGESR